MDSTWRSWTPSFRCKFSTTVQRPLTYNYIIRDWKKLTFYYFADAYINFNALVTDLFKVYKTRIWMSAINPASFASPSLGLQAPQAPSGIGPGAVGGNRTTQTERRPQPAEQQQQQQSYGVPQAGRGYQNVFAQPFTSGLDRSAIPQSTFPASAYTYGYSPFGAAPRNVAVSPNNFVPMDPFAGFPAPSDYQGGLPARFPSPHGTTPSHEGAEFGRGPMPASNDGWISSFQGLSMNSR